jgi:hypothetical protein
MTVGRRVTCALLAGAPAIGVNTFLLAAADWIPLATARGGILKLLTINVSPALADIGAPALWATLGLPAPGSHAFQLGFHVVVGLAMALLYGLALERRLLGPPWMKGLIYAAVVWAANALAVLPWLGEGVAGSRYLGLAGMAYFAAAHTVFFLLLAVWFARCRRLSQHTAGAADEPSPSAGNGRCE